MTNMEISRETSVGFVPHERTNWAASPTAHVESRWYVAQTHARHEKRVAEQLQGRGLDYLLPLYQTVSRWKDRRVRLELPLFECYVFVRIRLQERLRVLQIPSVLHLVGFGGLPMAVPDAEIESLRSGVAGEIHFEPHPYLNAGRRVRIVRGPLEGSEGILIRKKNSLRVVISVNLIMRSIVAEVDTTNIEPIL